MLVYHPIDPVAVRIGPLSVHWYGLMYLLGFFLAWFLGCYRADKSEGQWTREQVADLLFYGALGVVIGGRVGYMLFYYYPAYGLSEWWQIFRIWTGGMSFHGGLLGVMIALSLFAKKTHKTFFQVMDFTAPLVPLGLAAGRIGNFINGELWGRVTDVPWGVVFPWVDNLPRHPSQLYECFLEGVVLFIVLWRFSAKPRPPMAVSGVFLLGYGMARIFAEFFRQPDQQIGFILGTATLGQLLSLPLLLLGALLVWRR